MLTPAFSVDECSLSQTNWNVILISMFLYLLGYEVYDMYTWPPQTFDVTTILMYLFNMPFITDYVVIVTVCFYLSHIGCRFQTLNDFWKCLPPGLVSTRGRWTNSEIVMLVESIRLLHAKLSQLLKTFNSGYGLLLLSFFVCNIVDMIYIFYLMVEFDNSIKHLPIHLVAVQIIFFLLSVIVVVSQIHEKVPTSAISGAVDCRVPNS